MVKLRDVQPYAISRSAVYRSVPWGLAGTKLSRRTGGFTDHWTMEELVPSIMRLKRALADLVPIPCLRESLHIGARTAFGLREYKLHTDE